MPFGIFLAFRVIKTGAAYMAAPCFYSTGGEVNESHPAAAPPLATSTIETVPRIGSLIGGKNLCMQVTDVRAYAITLNIVAQTFIDREFVPWAYNKLRDGRTFKASNSYELRSAGGPGTYSKGRVYVRGYQSEHDLRAFVIAHSEYDSLVAAVEEYNDKVKAHLESKK